MNNKELEEFVELLVPHIIKRLKEDREFKNYTRTKNATVVTGGSANANVSVKLPYDDVSFSARNKTGETLSSGDLVCIEYWVDLKNAVVKYKVE